MSRTTRVGRPYIQGTRQKLMEAAEQLFADRGVDGALTREIVELAGQANTSALQYHFGSRQALLQEILAGHVKRVESALRTDAGTLPELIAAYVDAEASELRTDRGRNCLRIVSQLAHETGFRDGEPHVRLRDGALWRLFETVAGDLGHLPVPLARERVEIMIMTVGAAFADRARHIQAGRPTRIDEPLFRADLATALTAMLTAPAAGA